MNKYPNITRLILEEDREFHLFLSGGRVRVIIDKADHGDNFYGEGADIYECLDQAEKNCDLKLTYDQGYQNEGHPFQGYLTGGYAVDIVDASLFNFGYFNIRKINNKVWIITEESDMHPVPVIAGNTLDEALDKFKVAVDKVTNIPYYDQLRK